MGDLRCLYLEAKESGLIVDTSNSINYCTCWMKLIIVLFNGQERIAHTNIASFNMRG